MSAQIMTFMASLTPMDQILEQIEKAVVTHRLTKSPESLRELKAFATLLMIKSEVGDDMKKATDVGNEIENNRRIIDRLKEKN